MIDSYKDCEIFNAVQIVTGSSVYMIHYIEQIRSCFSARNDDTIDIRVKTSDYER
jgi:hypothetical protein